MRGVVQIYSVGDDGEELLLEEDNLTVDGFGEKIVDMLTMPSALASVTTPASVANFLDASNYTIQAISTSKQVKAFEGNAHAYTTDNLLYWTDFPQVGQDGDLSGIGWYTPTSAVEANVAIGPVPGVSGTRISRADGDEEEVFTYSLYMDGTNYAYDTGSSNHPAFNDFYFSGTDFTFSIDVKVDESYMPDECLDSERLTEIYVARREGASTDADVKNIVLAWDVSGKATIFDERNGASSESCGGMKDLGGGWYRVFVNFYMDLNGAAADSRLHIVISPSVITNQLRGGSLTTSKAGAIFVARPQLELGHVPTEYVANTTSGTLDDTLRFSNLNGASDFAKAVSDPAEDSYKYYFVPGDNGASVSALYRAQEGDVGVCAYIPPKTPMIPYPHPEDRKLTKEVRTPVEKALGIQFSKEQTPAALSLSGDLMLSSYSTDWSYGSGYTPYIGRHVAFLGGYSRDEGLVEVFSVTGLDEAGYASPTASGVMNDGLVGNDGIDRYGFIPFYNNAQTDTTPGLTNSVAYVSANSDFSSTGEVTYNLLLHNGASNNRECGVLNQFGGVHILGLWGLDLKQTRKDHPTQYPPYNYLEGATDLSVEPVRRYKLMSKKVLTDNLVRSDGDTGSAGLDRDGEDLLVRWVIKFL